MTLLRSVTAAKERFECNYFLRQRIHSGDSWWDFLHQYMQQIASDVKQRLRQVGCERFILKKE